LGGATPCSAPVIPHFSLDDRPSRQCRPSVSPPGPDPHPSSFLPVAAWCRSHPSATMLPLCCQCAWWAPFVPPPPSSPRAAPLPVPLQPRTCLLQHTPPFAPCRAVLAGCPVPPVMSSRPVGSCPLRMTLALLVAAACCPSSLCTGEPCASCSRGLAGSGAAVCRRLRGVPARGALSFVLLVSRSCAAGMGFPLVTLRVTLRPWRFWNVLCVVVGRRRL
jgi:hypothetical protein